MPAFTPLSARSVVLSLLLGTSAEGLTAAQVAAAADHFGVRPATTRVALTRAVAAGELRREGASYRLGDRLLARRERQEQHAAVVEWDGTWQTLVVVSGGRPSTDRAALRTQLAAVRLAELREGVWMRPANLRRPVPLNDDLRAFTSRPDGDPVALAADLWDLPAWAAETDRTLAALAATTDPAARLAVAAHLVRHLSTDPLLPPDLCPRDWPATTAREAYAAYMADLEVVVQDAAAQPASA